MNVEADVSMNRITMKLSNEKIRNPERNLNSTYEDKIRLTAEPSGASGSGRTTTKIPENHVIRNSSSHVSGGCENVSTRQEAQKTIINNGDNNQDSTEWKLVERKKQKPQNKLPTVMVIPLSTL
ncbi:hypothetical protein HHI36_008191, partial [Cryptolaemus montrouzieri]